MNRLPSRLRIAAIAIVIASSSAAQSPTPVLSASSDEATRWADETLSRLSLKQKVAQMMCEQMRGDYTATDSEAFRYWSELARDYGIGGFVVYGGTPHETAALINRLQNEAELPLLMSADFEGGPGQQFAGAAEFPANMALSAAGDETLAYEVGRVGAREGRAIGIHLTYSPVVDIQTRPENPVLSVRSFGADVDLLGRMASALIRGYQDNGMLATAKHYPGRGDVDFLTDSEYLINRKAAAQVEAEDLAAFKKAIDAGVSFVMSEHIEVPSITEGSNLPASASPALSTTWLRHRLGFEGVLTTDDLWYPKVVARFGAERAGVLAIQAGHDVLLKPANTIKMIDAVVAAVEAGALTPQRIDASVRRILYWKARLNLHRERLVDVGRIASIVGSKEHLDLVQRIAERSLTVLANRDVFPTTAAELGTITHVSIQKRDDDTAPAEVSRKLNASLPVKNEFVIRPNVNPSLYEVALASARETDTVIVSLFHQRTVYRDNGALSVPDQEWLQRIIRDNPRTIVMSYGNPYAINGLESAAAFVVGYGEGGFYGNQLVYADAFVRLLRGEIEATGKLPVTTSLP
jgi:beta-N-acetylhexosaminidase